MFSILNNVQYTEQIPPCNPAANLLPLRPSRSFATERPAYALQPPSACDGPPGRSSSRRAVARHRARTRDRLHDQVGAAADLDLRDIDAFDAEVAYALSIGSGDASRIFKTTDGGKSWETQFVNQEPQGYFAASGTNVTTWGTRHAWLGTGAASQARVLRSTDRGRSWEVATTPLPAGPSTGIFSIAFRDANNGVIVGGDYEAEDAAVDNVAITHDGGRTWSLPIGPGLSGYRSAVATVPGSPTHTWLTVGPSGADYSINDGNSWMAGDASATQYSRAIALAPP